MKRSLSRRRFMIVAGSGVAGSLLASCAATPQVVEREIVKEVVVTAAPEPISLECKGHVTLGYYVSTTPSIDRMQRTEERFGTQFPDVDLEVIQMVGDKYGKYAIMLAAGNAPDVMWMGTGFWRFVAGGAFLDLNPLVETDPEFNRDDYYPQCLDYNTWRGGLYGLAYGADCDVYAYNQDLFDEEGVPYPKDDWTHNDYIAIGKALTKDLDGDGRIDQYGMTDPGWYQYVWQEGGDILTPECDRSLLDSEESIAGLQLAYDLTFGKYQISAPPDKVQEQGDVPMFTNGTIGMRITVPVHMPVYRESATFRWDVVSAPNQKGTWFNPESYVITATTSNKAGSWCLVKFLCGPELQETLYAVDKNAIPSLRSIAESPAWLENGPANIKAFNEAFTYERHWPKHPISTEAWAIIGPFIDQMYASKITAAEAGQQAAEALNKKLLEYKGIWEE